MNWQQELLNQASKAAKAATAPKSKASKVRTRVSPSAMARLPRSHPSRAPHAFNPI